MKIKDIAKDVKFWIVIALLAAGIIWKIKEYADLPKTITAVKMEVKENRDNVQKLGEHVGKFVIEQKVRAEEQEKRAIQQHQFQETLVKVLKNKED